MKENQSLRKKILSQYSGRLSLLRSVIVANFKLKNLEQGIELNDNNSTLTPSKIKE